MLQAIACYRGDRRIPDELHGLCNKSSAAAPTPANSPLEKADVALAEPNTSIEIEFDGYHLGRAPVLRLLTPLRSLDLSARALCSQWFDKGIVAMNDEVRRRAAEQLIPLIADDAPDRELTTEILRGARGARSNVRDGMERLAKSLEAPLGIVTFTWSYMPDGRAVSWPPGFHVEVLDAARDLKLPVFEPHRLVTRTDFGFALKADRRHYTDAFMPVVAKPLVQFALSIAGGANSGPCD
ncbi:MAG: hypothetical protein ABI306_11730 [Caulobacteraceae bacterium]